ncbi:pro-resilin-like [Trichogramma pretiosum]|uniref:pro-resilin-like n=1 Tax=Trichogramma pretiosum TaxID=7493 RepID=UPI0006C9CD8D|nr:pro-resilin-like [Trichogramma pretiosum]
MQKKGTTCVLLLTTMLVGIRSEPQGSAYLPPSGISAASRPQADSGHPDDWAGDPVNYEFSYEVQDASAGLDFGHHEMRKDEEATGSYHVLLPDGRMQIVDYIADANGYRPIIRYEGTASYPAPAPYQPPSSGGSPPAASEGYKYRKK